MFPPVLERDWFIYRLKIIMFDNGIAKHQLYQLPTKSFTFTYGLGWQQETTDIKGQDL